MTEARVTVAGEVAGAIDRGLLVLLGVGPSDTDETAAKMAGKIAGLRLFEDQSGRMNLAAADIGGSILAISQFTLYGDVRRGRRPSFAGAAAPEIAEALYDAFCAAIEREGLACERGEFGAQMEVELVNDGPVTLIIDSDDLERPRRT